MAATLPSTIKIREHVPLRDFTTFRIGGPARFFCEISSEAELAEAIAFAGEKKVSSGDLPIFILGGGSNILVSDEGFDGLVIQMKMMGVDFDEKTNGAEKQISRVTASAGENWDDFVARCVERGLFGLENLSGIPGTVGAAPVQNIGAYGVEVSRTVESVRAFDMQEGKFVSFSNKDCGFEYRDSIFKKANGRYVIVSVEFKLQKEGTLDISYKDLADYFSRSESVSTSILPSSLIPTDVRAAVLAIRAKKLPDVRIIGTAGSFFKNPIICDEHYLGLKKKYPDLPSFPAGAPSDGVVKVPLAWILDHVCGYKGVTKGNVGTYQNQALVIVNHFSDKDGATAADIKKFVDGIIATVKEKTSIDIEPEVQYVGR